MAANTVLRAARPGERARRPKTFSEGRVCGNDDCRTIVSRYNQDDFCFRHRPPKFPRLRGVFTEAHGA